MKIKKTLAITSVAGGSNGVLSDALNISVNKEVTIDGNVSTRVYTIGTDNVTSSAPIIDIVGAVGRSIVYLNNKSTTAKTITVYSNSTADLDAGAATELIMELKQGEFAIFPAALDYKLSAVCDATGGLLEVSVFTEA